MKEIEVNEVAYGQTLVRYLNHLLPNAGSGFLYKMLRKKNITLNGKKASGKEVLQRSDVIRIFFSDETFEKFSGAMTDIKEYDFDLNILYEDDDILAVDKPVGILSQKDSGDVVSMNEYILSYLKRSGALSPDHAMTFKPSVANRLDRNTGGILLAGKTYRGQEMLSRWLRDKDIKKYYYCLCEGRIDKDLVLKGFLKKDHKDNIASVTVDEVPGSKYIETHTHTVACSDRLSLLRVSLLTGRSHQIRAHLKSIGHPLIGDPKYADAKSNEYYRTHYGIKYQLLHSAEIVLPGIGSIVSPLPDIFFAVCHKEGIDGNLEFPGA